MMDRTRRRRVLRGPEVEKEGHLALARCSAVLRASIPSRGFGFEGSRRVSEVFAGLTTIMGPPVAPSAPLRPHLMEEMGHKPHGARRRHHIGAAEGPHRPAAAPCMMAVAVDALVAGAVCEPMATLGL